MIKLIKTGGCWKLFCWRDTLKWTGAEQVISAPKNFRGFGAVGDTYKEQDLNETFKMTVLETSLKKNLLLKK